MLIFFWIAVNILTIVQAQDALDALGDHHNVEIEFHANRLIGISQSLNGNFEQAIAYSKKIYKIADSINNKAYLHSALINLDASQANIFDNTRSEKDKLLSEGYLAELLDLAKFHSKEIGYYKLAIIYINASDYYSYYNPQAPNADSLAMHYLNLAYETVEHLAEKNHILAHIYSVHTNILRDKNPAEAEKILKKSIELLKNVKPANNKLLSNSYRRLARFYAGRGDFKGAYDLMQECLTQLLTGFNEESKQEILNLTAIYEIGKKNEDIKVLEEKTALQRNRNVILSIAIGFAIATALFIYFYYKSKRDNLELEKRNIAQQLHLKNEENEKMLLQKEVLELKQEKAHNINLMHIMQLNHKDQLLQEISSKIEPEEAKKFNNLLKNNNQVDKQFDEAKNAIEKVHPSFYKYLMKMSNYELTEIDLKYCSYIYLKFDSAEISSHLNVERKSVRMAKYRIKKKLGLDKEVDLTEFLRNLKF
ncbi:hypothetical protein C4F49_10245 [Sphingobacterium sp. KB22]|uniref:Tetratricopeptide repeat-containing protein n=1 Tax=Sphingobacterium hungaricum TaxID=2082723 RepID=A0A928YRE3_9SPHI|nr:hypothetical protein [Sphingobacterium hungaricum]